MFYVYILRSLRDGRFYIGSTSDLNARLLRHNNGGNISTRHRRPFELVYSEAYNTRQGAVMRERIVKSYKGGNEFKKLIEKH